MTLAVHKLPEEEDEIGEEEDHAHEDLLEKERAKSEINKKKDVEDDASKIIEIFKFYSYLLFIKKLCT